MLGFSLYLIILDIWQGSEYASDTEYAWVEYAISRLLIMFEILDLNNTRIILKLH